MLDRVFRTVHAGCFGLIGGVFVTLFVGFVALQLGLGRGHADPIPESLAQQRLGEERLVAESLGLVLAQDRAIHVVGPDVQTTPLDAGECLAVIAVGWGKARVSAVAIAPPAGPRLISRGDDVLSQQSTDVVVAHTQYCAPFARDVEIWTWVEEHVRGATTLTPEARVLVLRGSIDPVSLSRGWMLRPERDLPPSSDASAVPSDAGPPDAGPTDGGPADGGRTRGRHPSRRGR